MLILNASDVRAALPMKACIEAMKEAYKAYSSGKAQVPLRVRLPIDKHEGVSLIMPAHVNAVGAEALGVKIASVFSRNPSRGLPLIHAAVIALNPETGKMEALIEGGVLTAIRTGAGAGAATDALARKGASRVAILGAGVQARSQLQAVCEVREISTAWIYAPDPNEVEAFISELAGKGPVPQDLRAASSSKEALREADIICAATTSNTPVFEHADLKAGTHVNGIGSYTVEMQEVPSKTVAAARVYVDSRSAALAESGDLTIPLGEGAIREEQITEIGELLSGNAKGRQSKEETTFFKSVGIAVQDAAAARLAVENAHQMNLGIEVDW